MDGSVCINVSSDEFPGPFELKVYNSAGEYIRTLYSQYLNAPLPATQITWDGRNRYGQQVATGVYLFYLQKPYGHLIARLVVIH
jgi:hypothetical protein